MGKESSRPTRIRHTRGFEVSAATTSEEDFQQPDKVALAHTKMPRRNIMLNSSSIMQQNLIKQLRQKRRELEEENAGLRALMTQRQELEADVIDQAGTASSWNWHITRYNRNSRLLRDMDVALKSLDGESYGLCELCGEKISPKRLAAVPGTRLCVDCQEISDTNDARLLWREDMTFAL
jgi:DnaK suppressor protein